MEAKYQRWHKFNEIIRKQHTGSLKDKCQLANIEYPDVVILSVSGNTVISTVK